MATEVTASDVLERWYAAWNAHDADAVVALLTDDVRYEDPGTTWPVLEGRRAVEDWVRAAFQGVPDMHLEKLEEWVTPGDTVIASHFRFTATFSKPFTPPGRPTLAPTNSRIEALGMDRSEIRDGRLARHQIFWDQLEVARQMAFLPPRDSAMDRAGYRLQHFAARRMRGRT